MFLKQSEKSILIFNCIKQNLERRFLFPPETLFLLLLIWHPQPLQTRSYSGVQVTLELTNPPASASSVLKLQAYTITSGHLAGAENFQKENNIFFYFSMIYRGPFSCKNINYFAQIPLQTPLPSPFYPRSYWSSLFPWTASLVL